MSADAPERYPPAAPRQRRPGRPPATRDGQNADGPTAGGKTIDGQTTNGPMGDSPLGDGHVGERVGEHLTWPAPPGGEPARRWWSVRTWLGVIGPEAVGRSVVVGAAALVVLAAAVVTLLQLIPREQAGGVTGLLEVILAAVGAVAWWHWRARHDTTVAVLLALCCSLLGVTYATTAYTTVGGELPVTRWVMLIAYAGAQLSYLAALAHLGRGRRVRLGWADVVQAATLLILVAGVLWVLAPITGQAVGAFPPGLRWIPYFYVVASMLGLVLAWSALFRHREHAIPGLGLLCLGQVVLAITTFAVVVSVLVGDYRGGGALDLGWLIGTGLVVVSAAAREEHGLTWQRARQRLVLVGALLLVVGVLAVGVTGLVQDASERIADHHERSALLRHADIEIARLRPLELRRPLGAEETDMVRRSTFRARTDVDDAVALREGLGDLPAHDQLVSLPALLGTYRDHLLASEDDTTPTTIARVRVRLDRALAQVLEANQERLNADVEALNRVTAIVRLGVPLGLLVLGGAFVSSWMALGSRERALEQAQARHGLTKEVVRAQERERGRIAAELHDGPLQRIAAWRIKLEVVARKLDKDPAAARELLERLDEEVAGQAVELRRLMQALRPPVLDELGLAKAVRVLADEAADRHGFEVSVDTGAVDAAVGDRDIETLTYRIVQEVLTNVGKHAAADHARVSLRPADDGLSLHVTDDGRGMLDFAPDRLVKEGHFGLAGVSERVDLVGGRLRVSSTLGEGTTIEAWLPARPAGPARGGRE